MARVTEERSITVRRTISLSSRETRLRSLLETIAALNDHGLHPHKAQVIAHDFGTPSNKTRANLYQQIDELGKRGLVTLANVGSVVRCRITDAGRQIIDGVPSVEVDFERTVTVEIVWQVVEHTIDGARFVWERDTQEEADTFADELRRPDDKGLVAKITVERVERPALNHDV